MTARYQNGKIYKLVNDVDDEIYVGSTAMPLAKRKSMHKHDARRKPDQHVYAHLNEIGWEHVRIVLIEDYSCNSKQELRRREQHWIDELKPSLNKYAAIGMDRNERVECHCGGVYTRRNRAVHYNTGKHKKHEESLGRFFDDVNEEWEQKSTTELEQRLIEFCDRYGIKYNLGTHT